MLKKIAEKNRRNREAPHKEMVEKKDTSRNKERLQYGIYYWDINRLLVYTPLNRLL